MFEFALNFFIQFFKKIINSESLKISNLKTEILDFLFPPICGICGKLDKNWICDVCRKRIKKLEKFNSNYKIEGNMYFDKFLYCYTYKGIIRKLLLQYKFSNKAYLSYFFANLILNNKKIDEILKFYDIMIPVPMDKIKKKKRGYNQTELISSILCKKLKILEDKKSLVKIKQTKTQSTLNQEERRNNIKNAFLVNNKEKIRNKKIILFDDIYTTGATVNEISKILKKAGAKEILVLVIAKD